MTIVRKDPSGYYSGRERFEMNDTQELGPMPFPKLLEIMANIHTAVSNIGAIATGQEKRNGN